jgi:hypothetical protein
MTGRVVAVALLLAVSAWAAAGCGAPATSGAADPAVSAPPPADPAGYIDLLAGDGRRTAPLDDVSFILARDHVQMVVFVEDDGGSLQAMLPYLGPPFPVSGDDLERWNATRRFGRAFRDEDGRPVLACDLVLGSGVGRDAVIGWADLALALAAAFRDEMWPTPASVGPVNE